MERKEKFIEALAGVEKYSTSLCKIVNTLVSLELNYQATASIEYLIKTTGLTKPTIYSALKVLKKDKIISKSSEYRNTYIFSQAIIEELIAQYEDKQALLQK